MSASSAPRAVGPRAAARTADVAGRLGRRWRAVTTAAVVLMALVGWGVLGAGLLLGPEVLGHGATMDPAGGWTALDAGVALLMWVAMVFAMMVPTAAPTFRAYATVGGAAPAAVVAGYTAVWLGAAGVATAAQGALQHLGALDPYMAPAGAALSASILVAAGLYQMTPLKRVCLLRCRTPVAFADARPGAARAFRIGVEEGLACLGCCWALMAVMFAAGTMNLAAMALLGALMGTEKLVNGLWLTYVIGGILLAGGAAATVGGLLG